MDPTETQEDNHLEQILNQLTIPGLVNVMEKELQLSKKQLQFYDKKVALIEILIHQLRS